MSNWIKEFKLALTSGDLEALNLLLDSEPDFDNLEDLKTAKALIPQAIELIKKKSSELKVEFEKLNKAMKYQS